MQAGAQRPDAGGVDERHGAVHLEVDAFGPASVAEQRLGESPRRRRPVVHRVVGHLLQETRVALRALHHVDPQLVGQRDVAEQRPEVEIDAGREQRLRVAAVDPAREHLFPGRVGQRQRRVARHDVALAQREAARRQRLVDEVGQLEQALADALAVDVQDAVVLVGRDGLLAATLAAERQPAERLRIRLELRAGERQQAGRQLVVQVADQPRQLRGSDTLGDEVMRQPTDVGRHHAEPLDAVGPADRHRELPHREPVQREQVAFRDHAKHASAASGPLHHRDVADRVLRHQQGRVGCRVVGVERAHVARHHRADRGRQRHLGQDHAADEVGACQDAAEAIAARGIGLDHDDRTDVRLVHAAERLAQRRVGRAGQGPARAHQFAQHGVHGALGARLRGVGRLQLLARQIEQRTQAALAEVEEGRAALCQFLEPRARQHQAEGVGDGLIDERHRTAGQQRADGKAVADPRFERDLARVGGLTMHPALLHDEEVGRDLVGGRQHGFPRFEVRDFDMLDHELQVLGRHGGERHVPGQQLLQSGRDGRGRHSCSFS